MVRAIGRRWRATIQILFFLNMKLNKAILFTLPVARWDADWWRLLLEMADIALLFCLNWCLLNKASWKDVYRSGWIGAWTACLLALSWGLIFTLLNDFWWQEALWIVWLDLFHLVWSLFGIFWCVGYTIHAYSQRWRRRSGPDFAAVPMTEVVNSVTEVSETQ